MRETWNRARATTGFRAFRFATGICFLCGDISGRDTILGVYSRKATSLTSFPSVASPSSKGIRRGFTLNKTIFSPFLTVTSGVASFSLRLPAICLACVARTWKEDPANTMFRQFGFISAPAPRFLLWSRFFRSPVVNRPHVHTRTSRCRVVVALHVYSFAKLLSSLSTLLGHRYLITSAELRLTNQMIARCYLVGFWWKVIFFSFFFLFFGVMYHCTVFCGMFVFNVYGLSNRDYYSCISLTFTW